MDITFLVGNGFDLSLGYKTSYEDFYHYYIKRPNDPKHEKAIARLKKSIGDDLESDSKNWVDFEIGLGKFTKDLKSEDVEEYIAAYRDALHHLNAYLSHLDKISLDLNAIPETKWEEIRHNLCFFFEEDKERERLALSQTKVANQSNGKSNTFRVITFNYTTIIDRVVERIAQKPLEIWGKDSPGKKHVLDKKVFHVHGPLSDYPTLGVSKADQILNPEFRKNNHLCTTLIKRKAIDLLGSLRYSQVESMIGKSYYICLWGLSIGASDEHIWVMVNNWLKSDYGHHVFIFEYTTDPPNGIDVSDRFQKERQVIFRLLNHSAFSSSEKENLVPRVHVIFNTEKVLVFPKLFNPNE